MTASGRIRRVGLRYGPTLVVVAAVGYVLAALVDGEAIWGKLRAVEPVAFAAALGAYYVTVPIRARRWRLLLDGVGARPSSARTNVLILLSLFFNTVLPAKAGDLYRSNELGRERSTSRSAALGTVAAERVIDIVFLGAGVLVSLFLLAPRYVDNGDVIALLALAVAGGAIVLVLSFVVFPSAYLPDALQSVYGEFVEGLQTVRASGRLGPLVGLTASIWVANVVRTGLIFHALGVPVEPVFVAFVAFLIALLTGLPYTPAGIGVVEFVGSATLIGSGLAGATSVSIILLDRAITVVSVALVGLVVYVWSRYRAG